MRASVKAALGPRRACIVVIVVILELLSEGSLWSRRKAGSVPKPCTDAVGHGHMTEGFKQECNTNREEPA
jgi:hypothetical protein